MNNCRIECVFKQPCSKYYLREAFGVQLIELFVFLLAVLHCRELHRCLSLFTG